MKNTDRLFGGFDNLELPTQLISDQNITSEPVKSNQIGLSVAASMFVIRITTDAVGAAPSINSVTLTSAPQVGDILSFTSGTLSGLQIKVKSVVGLVATVVNNFPSIPTPGDTLDILRYRYPLVDSSGVVTVTALQGTIPWITKDVADGSVSGGVAGTFSQLAGAVYNSTPLTLTTGQQVALQVDVNGRLITNTSGSVSATQGTSPWVISGTVTANIAGLAVFQTSQYATAITSIQITVTPLANRSSISLKAVCGNNTAIFVGNSSLVTIATGYPLFNGDALQMDITGAHEIWVISNGASNILYALELA